MNNALFLLEDLKKINKRAAHAWVIRAYPTFLAPLTDSLQSDGGMSSRDTHRMLESYFLFVFFIIFLNWVKREKDKWVLSYSDVYSYVIVIYGSEQSWFNETKASAEESM